MCSATQLFAKIGVERAMRDFWVLALLLFWGGMAVAEETGPGSVAEQYLFNAANTERAQRGVPPLAWDGALYRAALLHAQEMSSRASISHQYAGEADLAQRAQMAGVHFSVVAENVAEAPTAVIVHEAWMHSPGHRHNLLDERVDRVAIAVTVRRGELYAVEDFDRGVAPRSFDDQERAVAGLISRNPGMSIVVDDPGARETCAMSTGFAGPRRPWFVMRFSAGELDVLPEALKSKLASGRYRQASVGACSTHAAEPFSSYNIAVLLFP